MGLASQIFNGAFIWYFTLLTMILALGVVIALLLYYTRITNHPVEGGISKSFASTMKIILGVAIALIVAIIIGYWFVYHFEKKVDKGLYTKEEMLLGRRGIEKEITKLQTEINEESTDLVSKYSTIRNSILNLQNQKGQSSEDLKTYKIERLEELDCIFTQEGGYEKAKSEKEYYQIVQDIDRQVRKLGVDEPKITCSGKNVSEQIMEARKKKISKSDVPPAPAAAGGMPAPSGGVQAGSSEERASGKEGQ